MSKHIHLVVNPAAGKPEPVLNTVNEIFQDAGVSWTVSVTNDYGDAERQTREAVDEGADIIAAYGGDGTVMEVANGLIGSDTPMGILPGGTGNVVSIEVGLPQTLPEAVRVLVDDQAEVRNIDAGQCKSPEWEKPRHFLLRLALGFDAQRIHMTSRELRDRYGRMAYFIGALQAIPATTTVRYTFTLDGEKKEVEGFTCLIENAGNIGIPGISLAPGVSMSDGLLDVFCINNFNIASMTEALMSITNQPLSAENFWHWQAKEVVLESDPTQPVVGDGEKWSETPVTVSALPGALKIIVPAHADGI